MASLFLGLSSNGKWELITRASLSSLGTHSQGWRGGRNAEGEWGLPFSEDRTVRRLLGCSLCPSLAVFSLMGPSLVCGGRPSIRETQQESLHQAVRWQFRCRVQETGAHLASGTGSTFSILWSSSEWSWIKEANFLIDHQKASQYPLFSSYGLHGAI